MSQKTIKKIGWGLTIVLGILFTMSASMKLTLNEAAIEQANSMGFSPENMRIIGIIEIVSLLLFFIPRTGLLGSLLLVAYMGGAIATHLQHQQPVVMAVTVQVILWITIALRFPEIRQKLLLQTK